MERVTLSAPAYAPGAQASNNLHVVRDKAWRPAAANLLREEIALRHKRIKRLDEFRRVAAEHRRAIDHLRHSIV